MSVSDYRDRCLQEQPRECVSCGAEPDEVVVHHIDGDRENNDMDNLTVLCRRCHRKVHAGTYSGVNPEISRLRTELGKLSEWDGVRSSDRKQRMTFTLTHGIIGLLDGEQNMSEVVENALWEYYDGFDDGLLSDVARKQRVNFSLDRDVVNRLDNEVPKGERSETVEHALQEYLEGDD